MHHEYGLRQKYFIFDYTYICGRKESRMTILISRMITLS